MLPRFGLYIVFAAVLFTQIAGSGLRAQSYIVTEIGSLDGNNSTAWKVNDRGQVVGWSTQSEPFATTEAVFWSEETGLVALGQIDGLLDSFGVGLSAHGTVVGYGGRSFEDSISFVWTAGTGMELLPGLGGIDAFALDVNDAGLIVGWGRVPSEEGLAFLVEDGSIRDLGTPVMEMDSNGDAINNLGDVLVDVGTRLYIWTDGEFSLLPSLGNNLDSGRVINDLRQVAGTSRTDTNSRRAVIWSDGGVQDLGVLVPSDPSAFSIGEGMNNRGTVIGSSVPETPGNPSGLFICEAGCPDGMVDLVTLLPGSAFVSDIFDINNAGQIVGVGSAVPGGLSRGLLLTPVDPHPVVISPEPGVAGTNNTLDLLHFTSGAQITLMSSLSTGSAPVAGCPGLDLDLDTPETLTTTTVDGDGRGSFDALISALDEGQARYFQAVDLNNCEASAVAGYRFSTSLGLFADSFESGNTSAWTQAVP